MPVVTHPKRWLLVALPILLAATGCQPRDGRSAPRPRELMHTGFDEFVGWAPQVLPLLTTEKTHSGKFAVRVDAQHPYSLTFRSELGQLCPSHRPRRLTLGAWVWVPSFRDDAVLVVSISNPGDPDHPVFQKNVYLNDSGAFQQWKYVSRDLDLPLNLSLFSKSSLVIYLWSASAEASVYADDLQLTELW